MEKIGYCIVCGRKCKNGTMCKTCYNYERKLAEKDREIKLLNAMINTLPEHDKELEEIHNEKKITFAIEQLKKVKEKFGYKYNSQLMVSSRGLCDYIDNQIKQLEEGE